MNAFLVDACGNYILFLDFRRLKVSVEKCYDAFIVWKTNNRPNLKYDLICTISYGTCIEANFWNVDGTREDVCFNAMRSIPTVFNKKSVTGMFLDIATRKGLFRASINGNNNCLSVPYELITYLHLDNRKTLVDVGTPHFVLNVDKVREFSFKAIENIENQFMNYSIYESNKSCLVARTFERGVGETNSCGSGAVSIAVKFQIDSCGTFKLPFAKEIIYTSGQTLLVEAKPSLNAINLTGKSELLEIFKFELNGFIYTKTQ